MSQPPVLLRQSELFQLPASIQTPAYDRTLLRNAIVHIGVGGFNRSHLAVYLDDLLRDANCGQWGECGVGLLPNDKVIHTVLKSQDCLYSLLLRDADDLTLRVIGSLTDHLFAPADPEGVIARMASPECAIVSLTVTEGGYFIDSGSKRFQGDHPDLQHDLASPSTPKTFLGFLAAATERRRQNGTPFTVMSCDNLQGNGHAAQTALLAFAEMKSPALRRWIEANVTFPNSMVDRITPATTSADRTFITQHFGIEDGSPVVCEPFRQWVLEDNFAAGRPAWEHVGAQLTSDVTPFERVKMRLLNGGHSTLAYISALLGIQYVSDAVADPDVLALLQRFLDEVSPLLPELPGMELESYKKSIIKRFANPTLRDQISRICSEGSAKLSKFIIPSAEELRAEGHPSVIIPLMVASWLFSMRGIDQDGRSFPVVDASSDNFRAFAETGFRDARVAANVRSVFASMGQDEDFVQKVQTHLSAFHANDARTVLRNALARNSKF
ncbi:MAG TPA: mannitol dehydrogenase family protein [Edaphobacter sp.]|nr:mannitol dehydrogenase family protein [Edaphobacter sp.]